MRRERHRDVMDGEEGMTVERRERYRRAMELAGDFMAGDLIEVMLDTKGKTGLSLPNMQWVHEQAVGLASISRELRALREWGSEMAVRSPVDTTSVSEAALQELLAAAIPYSVDATPEDTSRLVQAALRCTGALHIQEAAKETVDEL